MSDEATELASLTVGRVEMGSCEFVLKNYSNSKRWRVNKSIASKEFMAGGYKWAIRFYPNGKKNGIYRNGKKSDIYKNGDISLFISLEREYKTPVPHVFEVYMIDQSGRGNHWGCSSYKIPGPQFVPSSIFCSTGSEFFNFIRQELPEAQIKPDLFLYATVNTPMFGYENFIERAFLESSDYLKDDCLKINCTVGVFSSHIPNLSLTEAPETYIGSDFGRLLESKQGADMFFKVQGESFGVHKYILAARCPAFLSHFSDAHQHQEIVIPNIQPKVFKAMLQFIYTGFLEEEQEALGDNYSSIFDSFLVKMLAAADQFKLKRLQKICESRILYRVSEETVSYLLHISDLYHANKLRTACLRFAAENRAVVMESDRSKYLSEICLMMFSDLAGHKENSEAQLSSRERKEPNLSRILSTVMESFVYTFQPWDTVDKKQKIKED